MNREGDNKRVRLNTSSNMMCSSRRRGERSGQTVASSPSSGIPESPSKEGRCGGHIDTQKALKTPRPETSRWSSPGIYRWSWRISSRTTNVPNCPTTVKSAPPTNNDIFHNNYRLEDPAATAHQHRLYFSVSRHTSELPLHRPLIQQQIEDKQTSAMP
ncbi:hypothetical protein J6590_009495 [Homalodisca vitripennis]|nr:hypothetical protein J6590_009495 [Homalodisca vitripennis]